MAPGGAGSDAAGIAADSLAPALPTARSASGWLRSGGYDVTTVGLEDYVARVVSAEAASGSGLEARKALAIVVRTFALRTGAGTQTTGSTSAISTHCQVVGARTKAGDDAAAATSGQVLFAGGRPADVYYTASCGGHTERPSAVWPGPPTRRTCLARPEPECRGDQAVADRRPAADLLRALAASGRRGETHPRTRGRRAAPARAA